MGLFGFGCNISELMRIGSKGINFNSGQPVFDLFFNNNFAKFVVHVESLKAHCFKSDAEMNIEK